MYLYYTVTQGENISPTTHLPTKWQQHYTYSVNVETNKTQRNKLSKHAEINEWLLSMHANPTTLSIFIHPWEDKALE